MIDFLDMVKSSRVYLFGNGDYKFNFIYGWDLVKIIIDEMGLFVIDLEVGGFDIFI